MLISLICLTYLLFLLKKMKGLVLLLITLGLAKSLSLDTEDTEVEPNLLSLDTEDNEVELDEENGGKYFSLNFNYQFHLSQV